MNTRKEKKPRDCNPWASYLMTMVCNLLPAPTRQHDQSRNQSCAHRFRNRSETDVIEIRCLTLRAEVVADELDLIHRIAAVQAGGDQARAIELRAVALVDD